METSLFPSPSLWEGVHSLLSIQFGDNNNNNNNRGLGGIAFPSSPPLKRLWLLFLVALGRAGLGAGELRCSAMCLPLCVWLPIPDVTDKCWRPSFKLKFANAHLNHVDRLARNTFLEVCVFSQSVGLVLI